MSALDDRMVVERIAAHTAAEDRCTDLERRITYLRAQRASARTPFSMTHDATAQVAVVRR